jgi:eukaryotic-like serine/threonine-protein kinase
VLGSVDSTDRCTHALYPELCDCGLSYGSQSGAALGSAAESWYPSLPMFNSVSVPQQDRTGELVAGRYELVKLIDSGGQGHVYRAHDARDDRVVAVKILKNELIKDAEWRERMIREARALTLLAGAAAVKVHDQATTSDGALCLVMEFLKGADFEDTLRAVEANARLLSLLELERIIAPVVETLELAHRHSIVHRDVKPGNIFVLDDGSVRLLDFGFAKFLELSGMTQAGYVAGSPSYLAPEVWLGSTDLDQRVDIYALGAVVFRALAGRPPFVGPLPKLLTQATSGRRPSLCVHRPDLPRAVDGWVERALAIDPSERFASVGGLWDGFRRALA